MILSPAKKMSCLTPMLSPAASTLRSCAHCTHSLQPQQQQHHPQQHYQQQQQQQQQHHQQQQQQQPASESYSTTEPHATADGDDGPPPLPAGWGELRTGDGRAYYVFYPTGAVQWERPKPPAVDMEGADHAAHSPPQQQQQQQQQRSAEGGSTVATPGAGAADGDEGVGDANLGGDGGGGAGYAEEDAARGEVRILFDGGIPVEIGQLGAMLRKGSCPSCSVHGWPLLGCSESIAYLKGMFVVPYACFFSEHSNYPPVCTLIFLPPSPVRQPSPPRHDGSLRCRTRSANWTGWREAAQWMVPPPPPEPSL